MSFVCDLHTPEDVASPAISLYQFSIVWKAFGIVVDFAMEAKPHPCETTSFCTCGDLSMSGRGLPEGLPPLAPPSFLIGE